MNAYDGDDVGCVGNDRKTRRRKLSLDMSDVELLSLAVAQVFFLEPDRRKSSRNSGRRERGCLTEIKGTARGSVTFSLGYEERWQAETYEDESRGVGPAQINEASTSSDVSSNKTVSLGKSSGDLHNEKEMRQKKKGKLPPQVSSKLTISMRSMTDPLTPPRVLISQSRCSATPAPVGPYIPTACTSSKKVMAPYFSARSQIASMGATLPHME